MGLRKYSYDERGLLLYEYCYPGSLVSIVTPCQIKGSLNLDGQSENGSDESSAVKEPAYKEYYSIYSFDGRLLATYKWRTCTNEFIYGGSAGLIAEYRPVTNQVLYYTADQIHSTQALTDETGNIVHAEIYDPFGKTIEAWISSSNPNFRFAGKMRDACTLLYYFGARYYQYYQNYRFLSPDPEVDPKKAVMTPQAWNYYSYALNNPINIIDVMGLYWEYSQTTGQLVHVDNQSGARNNVATGYSGRGAGLNNPNMENAQNVGPIPRGTYDIGRMRNSTRTGPDVLDLRARPGTNLQGRDDAFQFHGDNAARNQTASQGCIIMPRNVRRQVGNSNDTELRVVQWMFATKSRDNPVELVLLFGFAT